MKGLSLRNDFSKSSRAQEAWGTVYTEAERWAGNDMEKRWGKNGVGISVRRERRTAADSRCLAGSQAEQTDSHLPQGRMDSHLPPVPMSPGNAAHSLQLCQDLAFRKEPAWGASQEVRLIQNESSPSG